MFPVIHHLLIILFTINYSFSFRTPALAPKNNITKTLKDDFESINFRDTKKLIPGTLVGITLSAPFLLVDKYIVERYIENTGKEQSSFPVKLGQIMSIPGDGLFIIPLALLGYSYGYIFSDENVRRGFLQASFNAIASTMVVQILKLSGRARPYALCGDSYCGYIHFEPPGLKTENRSFPSGHSQGSASFYLTLGNELCRSFLCKALLFSIPPIVGIGRVLAHDHWASDVVGGLIIGSSFYIF